MTLDGIDVSVDTTDPTAFVSWDPGRVAPISPQRGPGMRLTLHSQAVNSTGGTVAVSITHNYPTLRGADGEYIEPVDAGMHVAGGADPERGKPRALVPGGRIEALQSFDIPPDRGALSYEWNLGEGKVARFSIP